MSKADARERARIFLRASRALTDRIKPKTEIEKELLLLTGTLYDLIGDLMEEREKNDRN